MKIFIGYDSREDIAFEVARASILEHIDAEVLALRLDDLREMGMYWRDPDPLSATEFSFSRFLVPALCNFKGRALFMDCDFLVRKSLKPLLDFTNPDIAVWCVQHDYKPTALTKMDGQVQRQYPRKNWSSVVLWNCEHEKNRVVTPEFVNNSEGLKLHRFTWLDDNDIGDLDIRWNWLVGEYDDPPDDVKNVHWTVGGPYFHEYENSDFSSEWFAQREKMQYCLQRNAQLLNKK